ncbi:MAG: hypothetical protein WC413_03585 [Candidatus Nanoarchaeia archaeon]
MISWLILGVLILVGIIAISLIVYRKRKGLKQETDYKAFFILGIFWIIVGIIPGNLSFLIMGIAFMVIGLVNKKKWKKYKPWNKLSKAERQYRKVVMIIVGLLILSCLVLVILNLLK